MILIGKTYGELYGPAMEITDQGKADEYFEALVIRTMELDPACGRDKACSILKTNLGYYAGYYSHETRERVERLFRCTHPIFGAATNGPVTSEAALKAGMDMAKPSPKGRTR